MLSKEQNEARTRLVRERHGRAPAPLLQPIAAVAELDDTPINRCASWARNSSSIRTREAATGSSTVIAPTAVPTCLTAGGRVRHPVQLPRLEVRRDRRLRRPAIRRDSSPGCALQERVTIRAYPVEPKAGLLWTYMGPAEKNRCCPITRPLAQERVYPDRHF